MLQRLKDCEVCGNPIPAQAFTCQFCHSPQSVENFPKLRERVISSNLEAGLPSTEQALERLESALREARFCGAKVIRLIHGYGSTGRGGKIRDAVRRELGRKLARGEVGSVVHGENYSSTTNAGRDLISRFKELKTTERSDSSNPGLTIIEI
ncbi:MAG: Smr/MutS family protein [Verrucomicrobia bacterium]|nr:Smr/MutS family protein [Verrucomicrobiota bacterium]